MFYNLGLLVAAALAAEAPVTAQADPVEIRFCPAEVIRPYPLDSLRGVQGLLLQNVAIINRGSSPLALEKVTIQLRAGDSVVDERRLGAEQIAAAAKSGAVAQAAGLMKDAAFQFCDGRLLSGAAVGSSGTLQPGEALLLMQNPFAYKGLRTAVAVEVGGMMAAAKAGASAAIPIDASTSKTQFRWPLSDKRTWLVGSGASFHSTHRWAVPEEFALDIIAINSSGLSHRGTGTRNRNFFAYGADVVAAADGVVVKAMRGIADSPPMLRGEAEGMEAYYGRIAERQAENMAQGEAGISGNAVVLDHGNGEYSVYAHLSPDSIVVSVGEQVTAGQLIGKLGSSGNSTEPHLHFQVCNRPSTLSCAGIPPTFKGVTVLNADGPRPIQSGDLIRSQ